MIRLVVPGGHVLEALVDDAQALAYLLDAHQRAVVAIALPGDGNVEVELVVARVGPLLAKIPIETAGPQAGAGDAPVDGLRRGVGADALGARLEDAVLHHDLVVFREPVRHVVDEVPHHALPALGQVVSDAADAEPARVHASAAHRLDDVEDALAVVERVEDRGKGPHVLGEGAIPHQMTGNAEQLAHHHSDHLGAVRHVDAGQLLHRQDVGQVVHHPAEVIDAVGVGNERVPRLALAHLLGAPVVKADLGQAVDDLLAVELQDDADDPVGAGMLRADVQEHEIRALAGTLHAPVLRAEAQRLLLAVLALVGKLERPHLRGPGRMLLAQRVALPGKGHEDAAQRRVSVEAHAEHVPHLALVPVGRGPQAGDRGQRGVAVRQRHLDAQVLVPLVGEEVIEDREVALGLAVAVPAEAFVDGGEVVQRAEGTRHLGLEELQEGREVVP